MEEEQQYGERLCYGEVVLDVMRRLEGDLNVISNSTVAATTTETNRIEHQDATQQMVSTVSESYNGLRNLSENVDLGSLQDGWRGETVIRRIIQQTNENVTEDYLETLTLADDIIVIRLTVDHPQLHIGLHYSVQIIWNSRFSWREIMQHLQCNTYCFNFRLELIEICNNNGRDEVNISPREVVDGLPDVIYHGEDNENDEEVLCAVCYETLRNGESAKQLECSHVFHSNCIFHWFIRKINCPTCRYEPARRRS